MGGRPPLQGPRVAALPGPRQVLLGPRRNQVTFEASTHKDYYRRLLRARGYLPKEYLWFYNVDIAFSCAISTLHGEEGTPGTRQLMTFAVCTIAHRVPSMKERLKMSRATLKGWKKGQPSRSVPSLTRRMLVGVCGALLAKGRLEEAECTVDAWGTLLPAGEALGLNTTTSSCPEKSSCPPPPLPYAACSSLRRKRVEIGWRSSKTRGWRALPGGRAR